MGEFTINADPVVTVRKSKIPAATAESKSDNSKKIVV